METHILLFILAGILILILVGSSIWSNRREKSRVFSNTFSTRPPSTPINHPTHSDDPLASITPMATNQTTLSAVPMAQDAYQAPVVEIEQEVKSTLDGIRITLADQPQGAVMTNDVHSQRYTYHTQTPQVQQTQQSQPQQPQQTQAMLNPEPVQPFAQSEPLSAPLRAESALPEPSLSGQSLSAQSLSEQSLSVQMPESDLEVTSRGQEEVEMNAQNAPSSTASSVANMLMLYVVAGEGRQFDGVSIVQALEDISFKFGEQKIFHRHQYVGSDAPVLFSAANMLQPGIFELDKLEKLSTLGLVLFMYLPSPGNDKANFKLMLKSAEHLARALDGFVLSDRQTIFDDNALADYMNRLPS